jgi:UDPglucose--hexose-1-phosphate uridylyltransferase
MSERQGARGSEFRQDSTTGNWVLVAPGRGRRPDTVQGPSAQEPMMSWDASCPFCPGNEAMTPPEVLSIPAKRDWQVRVVPNKFAALEPAAGSVEIRGSGLFQAMDGVGHHEVVIETPVHNRSLAGMEPGEVEVVLRAFQRREAALRADPRVKLVLVFKNQGERAGTSLAHPHSQIIATPLVPPDVQQRLVVAHAYRDTHDRCLYCDLRDAELAAGERVVFQGRHFLVIQPFASRMPFETWVLPLRHRAKLGDLEEVEIEELAILLRNILRALLVELAFPAWNCLLHSAPVEEEHEECYLWHIQVLPRVAIPAGFELGTGISITTALPEETAEVLRQQFEGFSE